MADSEIKFQRIFESGRYSSLLQLSDGRLLTDDSCSFEIHKVILASRSDYFRSLFCGMDKDKRDNRISNISGKCLSEILCWIYINDICVTEMNIKDLLIGADYLLLEDLYLELKQNVKNHITYANCLKLCHAAYELNDKDMLQNCFTFILTKYEEIFQNEKDDLINFPEELLNCILRNRNLNVESERTVWQSIIYWAEECIESRLKSVPRLLSTIAIDEIDENLAKEILNHDILNHHMESLKSIQPFNVLSSHCDILRSFLQKYSKDFSLQSFRIPRKLNIISKYTEEYGEQETCNIFISYDETLSLCRKITHVYFEPEYLKMVENDLYIFEKNGPRCVKVNLKTMEFEPIRNVRYYGHTILAIENCIYMIGVNGDGAYNMMVYNCVENSCAPVGPLNNIRHGSAVTMGKNMFVVGVASNLDGMIMQMLDRVTHQWISLSSPKLFRSRFELVAYKNKIYLIGGLNAFNEAVSDVEVYNPETNEWHGIPPLPFTHAYGSPIVLNDQLFVYDLGSILETDESTSTAVRWNETKECWDRVENSSFPEKLSQYRFCTIDDTETIKHLTKQNRNSKAKMEKSPFNCVSGNMSFKSDLYLQISYN